MKQFKDELPAAILILSIFLALKVWYFFDQAKPYNTECSLKTNYVKCRQEGGWKKDTCEKLAKEQDNPVGLQGLFYARKHEKP